VGRRGLERAPLRHPGRVPLRPARAARGDPGDPAADLGVLRAGSWRSSTTCRSTSPRWASASAASPATAR
jgi:hypothetical protein